MTGIPADAYRSVAAALPGGVAVVAVRWRRTDHAMTVSSIASVSLDPPLVLFCVHGDARVRDALDDIDHWALNVLGASQAPVADWLASPGRPAFEQLVRVPHRPAPVSGAAWLDGAAAWFDCRTEEIHSAGDHDIVVGRVLAAERGDAGAGALVHLDGRVRPIG